MFKIRETSLVIVSCCGIAFAAGSVAAQDPILEGSPDESAATLVEVDAELQKSVIDPLIEQMRSPRFAERREAMKRLRLLGPKSHPALAKVALDGDPDLTTLAMGLLAEAMQSDDPELSSSARKAFEQIGKGDNPQGIAANKILREHDRPEPQPRMPRLPNNNMGLNLPQLIPPAFGQGGGMNLRISVKTINGVRSIEVVQNNETYRFQDVPGGIEVERPDGKGGMKKTVYKDAAELKTKDAEAFGVYQKAGGDRRGQNRMQLRFGPNKFPPLPRMQLQPLLVPPIPEAPKRPSKPRPVDV